MSSSTVESDSKHRTAEHNLPQPEDESSARLAEPAAFRAKHQSPASNRSANKDFTEKSEEHSEKKSAEKKLIDGVLERYWNQKEKQNQEQAGGAMLPDGNVSTSRRSHERDYRWPAETTLGDRRDRAISSQSRSREQHSNLSVPPAFRDSHDYADGYSTHQRQLPQDHDYKLPARKAPEDLLDDDDASMISGSADERGYKQPERSRFAHGKLIGDGPSSHNDPSSRLNEATNNMPSGFDATNPLNEEQRKVEAHASASITPCDPDVLFGRRQAQRKHPGNVRLRELCHHFHQDYRNGDRGNKTAITWRIVHMIQQEGGRFLKFDEDRWAEVSNDMAREKVAFTIRDTFHQVPTRDA